MRNLIAVAVLLAAAPAARAADTTTKPSLANEVIDIWNEEAKNLIGMAEDFPEAKFDYKPTPEVRTFAEQILHAAGANNAFVEVAKGNKPKFEDPPRATYKTKAQVVSYLKQSIENVTSYLKGKSDAAMTQPMKSFVDGKMITPAVLWTALAGHMSEHYGQLVVYYRLNKLVPPGSRPKK